MQGTLYSVFGMGPKSRRGSLSVTAFLTCMGNFPNWKLSETLETILNPPETAGTGPGHYHTKEQIYSSSVQINKVKNKQN